MRKILITLPDQLVSRVHACEKEIMKREKKLFEAASIVESDAQLNSEMEDWDITLDDGIKDESSIN